MQTRGDRVDHEQNYFGRLISTDLTAEPARQLRNLHALLDLSTAMSRPIHIDQLLQVIVAKTTEVLEANRSSLFLYDAERDELWSRIAQGLSLDEIRFSTSRGIVGHVARTREVLNIADAYEDERFDREVDKKTNYRTRSVLCMPILTGEGELLGVIEVMNKANEGYFDADDEALLGALSAHVAVALERARTVEAYAEKKRMQETLRLAHDIQMSMLPTRLASAELRRHVDLHAQMIPAMDVGGDFYDFFPINQEQIGFSIGDVSGKGVPAALFMAVSRSVLKSVALTGLPPAECVRRVNAQLHAECPPSTFVTGVYGTIDVATGGVEYCTAGHMPPFVVTSDGTVRPAARTKGIGMCLISDFPYQSGHLVLEPEDCLVLYTDGINEAVSAKGEMLSDEGVAAWLSAVDHRSSKNVVDGIFQRLAAYTKGTAMSDDATMLVVKRNRERAAEVIPSAPSIPETR